ncbi:YccF domain-containing protein [Nocardioides sambongensis]|uniref:YccF domain-containing protein n=1 Tax=Nocardioides sambongensis TaxID=2589074 RepID=UPI0011289E2F|nr:YccF domain-containing protein [Nocardioides sambongensis]
MNVLLNIIWLVLSGFWMFLGYLLVGALWCITIIGIPFGIASFRIGFYALWPFGRTVVPKPTAGAGSAIGNVLWFVLSGIWLAIGHAVGGVLLCVTIIGIPLGLASFKLIPVSLFPLGKDIVPVREVEQAYLAGRGF